MQVLADVVLERLIRGAAAGRPVAGESDCVPVADPVRVHGHVAGERRVEIVFVSAVRGRVPAVEPVAGNLARVAGRPTGFVGGGRVVGHGLRCGRAGRVAAGGRVHVVRQGGVDGPQCVYGLRPGGHDDLRPDVRVQRVPVHGVADGHVPVVGVRVRAPPVERAVGLADLAGIPAVGVGLRGRQCDPGAGRIVDLAAGYGARVGDGLHAHGTVGSGDRPLAGTVTGINRRVRQYTRHGLALSGTGGIGGIGDGMHAAGGFGGSGFHLACFGMRGHTALAAVRIIGEHLGAGDRNAKGRSAAAIASLGVLQIVAEGEAGAGPRGGQTMLDLLLAIEVRLRARVMLGACETVDPIGGELGIAGLVGTVEAGDQLNTLELQIGLSVPAVQIVEAGDAAERVGHGGAVLVREVHGPLASDALRRVDAAECLDHLRRQVGVPADGVDPEQVTACGRLAVQLGPQSADAAAVPRMQRDDRVD